MIDALILPQSIDHAFYQKVMECVIDRQEERQHAKSIAPLRLYCCSSGGESQPSLAIANAIQMDGEVEGILIGATCSAAATIFASCQTRWIHPGARLGIHPVAWNGAEGIFNHRRLENVADEFRWIDEENCRIYAAASNQPFGWWWDRYVKTPEMDWIDTDTLISIGMGKLWNNGQQHPAEHT